MCNKDFMTDSRARLIGLLSATVVAALSLATLLPTTWVPRTGLGWEDEHFIVYFVTTMILSLASRRPYVAGIALMICAGVLEAAQGLTPDRIPDFTAAVSGAAGVMSAATLVILLIRTRRFLIARRKLSLRLVGMAPASPHW
jgi:VanZ family protein